MNYYSEVLRLMHEKNIKGKINHDTKFKDLGIDSLDLMDLVVELEKHFGVEFSDEQLMNLNTVNDLVKTLEVLKNK